MHTRIKIAPKEGKTIWSYKLQKKKKRWYFWSTQVDGTFVGNKRLLLIFLAETYYDWYPVVE